MAEQIQLSYINTTKYGINIIVSWVKINNTIINKNLFNFNNNLITFLGISFFGLGFLFSIFYLIKLRLKISNIEHNKHIYKINEIIIIIDIKINIFS